MTFVQEKSVIPENQKDIEQAIENDEDDGNKDDDIQFTETDL